MWDYETIKAEARRRGVTIKDLLAQSPENDPFYVGPPAAIEKARWFADIYDKMGSPRECHIRRVHYWLVSKRYPKPDGTPYENTERDWSYCTLASKYARYLGLVPTENIIDMRNPEPAVHIYTWEDEIPEELKDRVDVDSVTRTISAYFACWNPSNSQPYHIEIWCEKSTMNDILMPIGQRYGVNIITGLGEMSITQVYDLVNRITEIGKPTRILYISDFDPGGEQMPLSVARKLEYYIRSMGINRDVKLKKIMLLKEQCVEYQLPRIWIKPTEARKAGWEEIYGEGATELDALEALHPGAMRAILEDWLDRYIDLDMIDEIRLKNREVQETVRSHFREAIAQALSELDLSPYRDYRPPRSGRIDDTGQWWLYDSNRDYTEQLRYYDQWKKGAREDTGGRYIVAGLGAVGLALGVLWAIARRRQR